jgi:glutamine phosphoribosylpyrophosphate amidotransferase
MCGVLGITIKNFAKKDHDLVRGLFIQSMIRGKHATGVSYVKNGKVFTDKKSVPADEFINNQNLEDWTNEDGHLYCVGHIRYSTSDLRYNQPMASDKLSVVHNGVISQELSETWESTYKLRTETSNDSELVLRAMEENLNPLQHFDPASMAVCALYNDKRLIAYRNGERPLYYTYGTNGFVFASTADILKRAGFQFSVKVPMYEVFTIDKFNVTSYTMDNNYYEDLQ